VPVTTPCPDRKFFTPGVAPDDLPRHALPPAARTAAFRVLAGLLVWVSLCLSAPAGEAKKGDDKAKDPGPGKDVEIPYAPPSKVAVAVGDFKSPASAVLLQYDPGKSVWRRLGGGPRPARVLTGRPLVSLPGSRSVLQTDRGVRLTLAGTMPELMGGMPLCESRVELHRHPRLDVDLTLERGRIALANTRAKPLRVRVRFANPTEPKSREVWDITLDDKDSEVLIDLFGMFPLDEPFYDNPNHPDRLGPVTHVGLTVVRGTASVRLADVTHALEAPPGPARLAWSSERGLAGPVQVKQLEDWARLDPPPPRGLSKEAEAVRKALQRALPSLGTALVGRTVDVGLRRLLESKEPPERGLAVRSLGALDLLPPLVDALGDAKRQDVRAAAIETLERWLAAARDNDYKLHAELLNRYNKVEAGKIVGLLHGPPGKRREQPETYDTLIDQLLSSKLAIRQLSARHLAYLWPEAAARVQFDAAAPREALQRARAAWRKLIPRGKVPPQWDKSAAGGK
jgi:hypothetical protein